MKAFAQQLYDQGFWVHPLNGKVPIVTGWPNQERDVLFSKIRDDSNIGVVTGEKAGIVVFDVDVKDGGVSFLEWKLRTINDATNKKFSIPNTWQCITGSGGSHYYFKYTAKVAHLKSSSKLVEDRGNKVGWDIKTNGGQVVVAPSIHPDTEESYKWVKGCAPWECEIQEMPQWLLDMLSAKNKKKRQTKPRRKKNEWKENKKQGQRRHGLKVP